MSFEALKPLLGISELIVSLVLVGLNAFFVASEFAIVKVRRTRLEELAGKGIAAARVSILCVDQLDEFLSATQLGITVVSLALGWVGEIAFYELLTTAFPPPILNVGPGTYHIVASVSSFFVITFLHVVLGELVPKSMAIQDAERVILFVSKPLQVFYKISKPLNRLFTTMANLVLRVLGYTSYEEPALSEGELKIVMKESKEDGVISDNEAQIINRAFEFSDKTVGQIMIAADKVDYVSLEKPLETNLEVVRNKMHTRFPLCETDFQRVKGIVHMKDVWPTLLQKFSNEAFEQSSRPPIFVSCNLKQDHLLKLFQSCRAHFAIVKDADNRNNIGVVTLENVLEGLVGDIRDEYGN